MSRWADRIKSRLPSGGDHGRVEELIPTTMPGLRRRDVLKHAWGHIEESWRTALAGALVTAILPPLYKWGDIYHFSHSGLDQVTSGDWTDSIIAVGVWLAGVAAWHLLCAPMSHAREVLAAHRARHAEELEQVRVEARSEGEPRIVQHVQNQWVLSPDTTPEQAAMLARQVGQVELTQPPDRRTGPPDPQATGVEVDHPHGESGEHESAL